MRIVTKALLHNCLTNRAVSENEVFSTFNAVVQSCELRADTLFYKPLFCNNVLVRKLHIEYSIVSLHRFQLEYGVTLLLQTRN